MSEEKKVNKKTAESSVEAIASKEYREFSREIRKDSRGVTAPISEKPKEIPGRPIRKEEK